MTLSAAAAQPSAAAFLRELRTAARNGDRNAVAAKIQFPIVVTMAGLRIPFRDAAAFLERYDDIFTPDLIETIARGDALIIAEVDRQLRITEINVPPASPAPAAPSADGKAASSPSGASGAKAPVRVGIRPGPGPTQFAGSLPRGGRDAYMLSVPKGRLLEVRLERIRGREALVRVVSATTGAPLNPRTAAGARVVAGIAREESDYRIEVRRGDTGDAAPLPYLLSLVLK